MKVRMVLEGKREGVMEAVAICLEAGVLAMMETVDETADLDDLPRKFSRFKPKNEYLKEFTEGRKVVVVYQRADRPYVPAPGSTGKVISVKQSGRGGLVEVEFDADGERVFVPSSMLSTTLKGK